jgi:hypothetical protein
MNISGGYIIDIDINKYANLWFDDTIPHEKLREILGRRVSDGVISDTKCPPSNREMAERRSDVGGDGAVYQRRDPAGGSNFAIVKQQLLP